MSHNKYVKEVRGNIPQCGGIKATRKWTKNFPHQDVLKQRLYLLYPLGACRYCNIVWLTALYLVTTRYTFGEITWFFFLFLGLAHLGLLLVTKIVNLLEK